MTRWHARYRRIIDAYRMKLMDVNPRACQEVDDQLWLTGDGWVSDDRPLDLDKLMTARDIADRFGLTVQNVRDWARRHPDKIKTHKDGHRTLYLVREVLKYQAEK